MQIRSCSEALLFCRDTQVTSPAFAGKLGRLWQHVSHVQTFCLAQKQQQRLKGRKSRTTYSRAALRDALKWAAAQAPAQPSLKVTFQYAYQGCMPIRHQLANQVASQNITAVNRAMSAGTYCVPREQGAVTGSNAARHSEPDSKQADCFKLGFGMMVLLCSISPCLDITAGTAWQCHC